MMLSLIRSYLAKVIMFLLAYQFTIAVISEEYSQSSDG